jgi:RHS repeat-associated protein
LFEYGNMGELTKNIHTFVVPGGDAYTFQTKWEYDSWNRVIGIYYPDGEYVSYEYDNGGKLIAMSGLKNSISYDYIDDVKYDKFGSRTRIDYGNGTYSLYSYHPQNRRLTNLQSYEMSNLLMHDLYYYYDDAGNITGQSNYGNYVNGNTGGVYEASYSYDDLYRLSSSAGYFSSYYNGYRQFDLEMSYSPSGNIVSKSQNAQILINGNASTISYSNSYDYGNRPHTVTQAGAYGFDWDLNGNMTYRNIVLGDRFQCWDEENRLVSVWDNCDNPSGGLSQLSVYLYDGGGERAWKLTGQEMETKLSGKGVYTNVSFDKTLYSSPLMVVTDKEYSKHYFIEGERVCTKIGSGFGTASFMPESWQLDFITGDWSTCSAALMELVGKDVECTGYDGYFEITPNLPPAHNDGAEAEYLQYFYHSDHLGSASFVTDATGYVDQHVQYLPFGELFISQRNSTFDSRYKFTAKELDNETQYTYFGARYLDSEISIWLSVDPLASKYPELSPYSYVGYMPIIAFDPDGRKIVIVYRDENNKKQKMEYTPGMTYSGDNEFVSNTVSALNHKYTLDSKNQNVINSLVSIRQSIRIKETKRGSKFVPLTQTVRWNPYSAMITFDYFTGAKTGAQTPASGLIHELGHGYWKFILSKSIKNALFFSFSWDDKSQYTTEQEKWVIENVENKCLDPDEAPRNTHYAIGAYKTIGPNTLESKSEAQKAAIDKVSNKIEGVAL